MAFPEETRREKPNGCCPAAWSDMELPRMQEGGRMPRQSQGPETWWHRKIRGSTNRASTGAGLRPQSHVGAVKQRFWVTSLAGPYGQWVAELKFEMQQTPGKGQSCSSTARRLTFTLGAPFTHELLRIKHLWSGFTYGHWDPQLVPFNYKSINRWSIGVV